jgi:hypothetical protein
MAHHILQFQILSSTQVLKPCILSLNVRTRFSLSYKLTHSLMELRPSCEAANCHHVRWVPYHHGVARPQVADGGDALQVWRVAANIWNKQSRTADKGWSSSLGVELTAPHRKK